MAYRRAAFFISLALALAGCQGGGSSPATGPGGGGASSSVTQSASIGPSGGTVSATIESATVNVIVPSGALSGPGTVSVTLYAPSTISGKLQSVSRKPLTLGANATVVTLFSVALTGATLLKPLKASTTAAGTGTFRLAGLGSAFDDIDTVTVASGTATSDLNLAYPRMSLAAPTAPGTFYAFYTTTAATTVPTPIVTVATTATNPIGAFGTAAFTASEAAPNGFPYLDPNLKFTLDNATVGSVTTTGAFTAGPLDGSATITATEQTPGRNTSGTANVQVSSQRPGNVGDTFTFKGTLSSTTQLVNSNPTQPQTDTANVTVTSTVTSAQVIATPVPAITTIAHSAESDVYPVRTISTSTDTGYGYATGTAPGFPAAFGPGAVVMTGSQATDSNGSTYLTSYDVPNGNGLIDVLPETQGPFGPNTAALHYTETDPAHFGRDRSVSPSGAYVEKGTDAFGDVQTATVNADLSAQLDARQYSGYRFTMSAPSGGSNSRIIFRLYNASGTQLAAYNLPSWIPATLTQPSVETDVDNGSTTFPAACNVPAKYGTSGNQIVQTINRADTAFGNLETLTTTTYTAPRVGPVCIQMTDAVKTFYDFTLQNGYIVLVSGGTVPVQLTSISETLALQSASTESGMNTSSVGRSTSSTTRSTSATRATSSVPSSSLATVTFARSRFDHAVRETLGGMRKATFSRTFGSQGVRPL